MNVLLYYGVTVLLTCGDGVTVLLYYGVTVLLTCGDGVMLLTVL